MLREQERKDRRDTFQRETLLALQDAIEEARLSLTEAYELQVAGWQDAGYDERYWVSWQPGDRLPKAWNDAEARINKLWARVFDADLQSSVQDFSDAANLAATTGESYQAAGAALHDMIKLAHQVNSRIGVLLEDLF